MSIRYKDLHKKALEFLPESPIKKTSTWVGVLVHSVSSLKDVKNNTDFVWMKCHPKITIRTLKHEYFSRHPIEDFEFKFNRNFLEETTQVKHLRRDSPIDSKVIVLRVFEEDKIDEEEDLEEAREEEIKKKWADAQEGSGAAKKANGTEKTKAVVDSNTKGNVSKTNDKRSPSSASSAPDSKSITAKKRKLEEQVDLTEKEEPENGNAKVSEDDIANEDEGFDEKNGSTDCGAKTLDEEAGSEDSDPMHQDQPQAENNQLSAKALDEDADKDSDAAEQCSTHGKDDQSSVELSSDHVDEEKPETPDEENTEEKSEEEALHEDADGMDQDECEDFEEKPFPGASDDEARQEDNDFMDEDDPFLEHGDTVLTDARNKIDEALLKIDGGSEWLYEDWTLFHARLAPLSYPHNAIDVEKLQWCEICSEYFFVEHYTIIGPGSNPLCWNCTPSYADDQELHYYLKFAALEFLQKLHNELIKGREQNMHPLARVDCPDDYPQPRCTFNDLYLGHDFRIRNRVKSAFSFGNLEEVSELIPQYLKLGEYGFEDENDSGNENEIGNGNGEEEEAAEESGRGAYVYPPAGEEEEAWPEEDAYEEDQVEVSGGNDAAMHDESNEYEGEESDGDE